MAVRGYDPVYGARPLKRVIQQNITNKLASLLISRDEEGSVHYEATISKNGDAIEFAEVVEDAEAWAEGD
jgi:ATP-dependent Clp protease ATP-binding subunit ClpB